MGAQTYIEINGKRVDAVTGKEISLSSASKVPAQHTGLMPSNGGIVDGFRRPKPNSNRTAASHAQKQTQRSQTLMRKSVKKPSAQTGNTHEVIKPSLKPPASRVARAQSTPKHHHVSKYDHPARRSSVQRTHAHLPVEQQPAAYTSQVIATKTSRTHATAAKVASVQSNNAMIEKALASANSHEQTHHNSKTHSKSSRLRKKLGVSRKTIALSSAVLAGVILGGFFAVQNVPNVSMRVAAARAGFDAQMPGYQPSGFSFTGPINYKPGQVVVSFGSNTDSRNYQVTQTNSNWNSDALLANFIEPEDKQYQTYLDRGRTLYIYDGSNATWIDDGIWFQIEGDSDLTTDQLIRIAASI